MEKKYYITVGIDSPQVIQFLEERIYEHNSNSIDKHDGHLFSRIVRDQGNKIIGGIAGWTWARACEITQLWVDENMRQLGVGKMLLDAAEEEAISKACTTVLVKSYSFQAPQFYQKYGYKVEHILHGFPEGYKYYTLVKMIQAP
jgi:ribosomal protein S18 acetylase RimI-like enzyme